jgi:MFS family permease
VTYFGMDFYHHDTLERTTPQSIRYRFVYLLAIIFTFHSLIVAFSSSTYLEQFIDAKYVGLLFSVGSVGSIIMFLIFPFLLQRFGNVSITIATMVGAVGALLLVGFGFSPLWVAVSFIIFSALNPLGYFSIDVFSETLIGKDEADTGKKRGVVLGLMSLAALAAPLLIGTIVGEADNLARLFFVSAGVGVVFIVVVVGIFRQFYDPVYQPLPLRSLYELMRGNASISVVIYNHFLLQLFFSWAIIYIPLYLATEIGLGWETIGHIIAVGLIAYALFEYPAGYIADRFIGEKEMMAGGFVILALTVAGVALTAPFGVLGWMMLMFINRTGASLVEATTESYFFKCVKGEDAGLMSIFRLLRPLAVLCGSLLGTVSLLFLPFEYIFFVLAFVLTTGIFVTQFLVDTK